MREYVTSTFVQNKWGDRKIRRKMLSFLYLLLFRDEISSNNAAIYMQFIRCNNACIKRTMGCSCRYGNTAYRYAAQRNVEILFLFQITS